MKKEKVVLSKRMHEAICTAIENYSNINALVVDFLNGKENGYFHISIPHVLIEMECKDFVAVVYDLAEIEFKESFEEKKERWKGVISELLEGELVSERKRGLLVQEALKDFGIL